MADQRKLPIHTPEQDGLTDLLFGSMMAQSIDAVVITTPENKISHWSASAELLFGYTAEHIIGKPIDVVVPLAALRELRNGTKNTGTIEVTSAAAEPITVSANFREVVDADQNLLAVTYIFRDLREQLKKDESVKQKGRALESFSYSVSHDLRAPLRRIINYAEILQEDHFASLDEEVQRIVSRMAKNSERMSELIDGLLLYSRVGQHPLQKSLVNVDALVRNIVAEFKNTVDGPRVTFHVSRLESCEADPVLLRQGFEQLISNAVKYSRPNEKPVIEIGCLPGKNETTYFVKDNGVGFDMQYAGKLFTVFQRLHNPADFEGTGVGLAIVHQIAARHGGTVRAEGKVDEGATFYFSLPK
ncbi:MAG TPA: ATP-binding protein [Chryseosolibacter sp.]